MSKPRLGVSDHAVLRYLQRRWGVNVAALRRRIAKEADGAQAFRDLPCRKVCKGGVAFVIEGDRVVTVLPRNKASGRKGRRR
ncbi:MAG: hypothetical protein AAF192_00330 [Pseudomonadota bacterium]